MSRGLPGKEAINPIPHTPMDDLCLDFVNSRFNDHRGTGAVYDRMALPAWWSWLLERWALGRSPSPAGDELAALRRLRSLIRRLLESGAEPVPRDRAALNRVLRRAPMAWRLAPGRPALSLVPTKPGAASVAASIVASCVDLLGEARPPVRRCGNPNCSFLFRDLSRNGSRRWCDPRICGNLVKVRAFRAGRAVLSA